jgi:tripartite-type tricarboxylate transporter receptor subunit TctC
MTALPNVPTAVEAGMDYETFGWLALLGPAGISKHVTAKLYQALEEAVNDPTVRGRFVEQGAEPLSPGPEELHKFVISETNKWRDIIQKAGIEPM